MGEIAQDLVNGACCSYCGKYFEQDHGYPVLCKKCWKSAAVEERKEFVETKFKEI